MKKAIFISIYTLMIIIIFVFIEFILRILNFGYNTDLFLSIKGQNNEIYIDNFHRLKKYINIDIKDEVIYPNIMLAKKEKIRGFIIGESTPQGYPYYENQAFGKIAEIALNNSGFSNKFEIINLASSAMGSYYVRDVALKALNYNPDFIIIYAGHNEYYGTLGAVTGENRFTKNLYLFLKEIKIFQLLFTVIEGSKNKKNDITLMEQQYKNTRVESNEEIDKMIADDFIHNIDDVVSEYEKRNIPVIIIDPVCNLIDMPPFSSKYEKEYSNFILEYNEDINNKDYIKISNDIERAKEILAKKEDAYLYYLNGKALFMLNKKTEGFDQFVRAKDMDTTPFRCKSVLNKMLIEYVKENKNRYKDLYWIPLNTILRESFSESVFCNTIFIDHLHFNWTGHKLLSQILVEKICSIYHFNKEEKQNINRFYSDESYVKAKMFFLSIYEIIPYWSINYLINSPPFSMMLIPYQLPRIDWLFRTDTIYTNSMLMKRFENVSINQIPNELLLYLIEKKDVAEIDRLLEAQIFLSPGSYYSYLEYARYLKSSDIRKSIQYFKKAYILSQKKQSIANEVLKFTNQNVIDKEDRNMFSIE